MNKSVASKPVWTRRKFQHLVVLAVSRGFRRANMTSIRARFLLLEPHAKLSGLDFDYADGRQNGQDCWFDATLLQLRRRGYRLPASFTVQVWRNETRQWMLERAERLEPFGKDYFEFVDRWKTAWITEPAMIAALSVLSARMQVDFEAVALATMGSDHVEPIKSESAVSHWGVTVRLMYGFDPERHWVAMVDASLDGEQDALRRVEESCDAELQWLVTRAETVNEVVHAEAEARLQEQEELRRRCAAATARMREGEAAPLEAQWPTPLGCPPPSPLRHVQRRLPTKCRRPSRRSRHAQLWYFNRTGATKAPDSSSPRACTL